MVFIIISFESYTLDFTYAVTNVIYHLRKVSFSIALLPLFEWKCANKKLKE